MNNADSLDMNDENNDENFESQNYDNLNINNINGSSNCNPKDTNNNFTNSNSLFLTNNNIENNNHVESQIKTYLKKYAKSNRYNNQKNSNLDKNYLKSLKLETYINRLKTLGYPDIGKIYLSPEKSEQEKTFNFFEFILSKNQNTSSNDNIDKYKKKYDKLEEKFLTLKKEISDELKINSDMQKKADLQLNKQKEFFNDQLSLLSKENSNLKNIINKLTNEKNSLSKQLYQMNHTLNKFESMKSTIIKAFETIDYVQSNDMLKMLSRVKIAEKLIETLKGEYSESLKEYLLEISMLKHFLNDINSELCSLVENPSNISFNSFDMPFMESIEQIKEAFKNNIDKIKQNLGVKNFTGNISQISDNYYDSINETTNMDKCS